MCSNATLVSHSWSAGLTAVSASPGLQGRSKEWRRGRVVFNEVEVACRIHGQRQVGSCPNVPVTVWHERCKLETKMRHAHLSTVSKLNELNGCKSESEISAAESVCADNGFYSSKPLW